MSIFGVVLLSESLDNRWRNNIDPAVRSITDGTGGLLSGGPCCLDWTFLPTEP